MDTPQFSGETTPPPHSGQQRFPTLRHCLEQFLDAAPAYYVRWHGEDMEVERFVARLQQDATDSPLLEQPAVIWDYASRSENNPYWLCESALSTIHHIHADGRVKQDPFETYEMYPIFNLERFRQFFRRLPQEVELSTDIRSRTHPLPCFVRRCFDQNIFINERGTCYLRDEPDADEAVKLPYWAMLFIRILGTIVYDNLAHETINWQDTVLNILEIVELLVAQYGELRNLIPV